MPTSTQTASHFDHLTNGTGTPDERIALKAELAELVFITASVLIKKSGYTTASKLRAKLKRQGLALRTSMVKQALNANTVGGAPKLTADHRPGISYLETSFSLA